MTTGGDQGDILLEKGIPKKGRIVNKAGHGVANTVVGIQKTEHRNVHAYTAIIGTGVKTDDSGYFELPALSGAYKLTVEHSVPDYSRQMMLNGETAPSIDPVTIEFDSSMPADEILLQENP